MPISFLSAVMWTFLSVTTYSTRAVLLHNGILHQHTVAHNSTLLDLARHGTARCFQRSPSTTQPSATRLFLTLQPSMDNGWGCRHESWCRSGLPALTELIDIASLQQAHVLVKVALHIARCGPNSRRTHKPRTFSRLRLRGQDVALKIDHDRAQMHRGRAGSGSSRSMTIQVHGQILDAGDDNRCERSSATRPIHQCGWCSYRCGAPSGISPRLYTMVTSAPDLT